MEKSEKIQLNWQTIVIVGLGLVVVILFIFLLIPSRGEKKNNSAATATEPKLEVVEQPRPTSPAITPQGSITFCIRLNGREDMHLPALLGGIGDDIYPNSIAGFNWSLPPTATGEEPYGILPTKKIFIKKYFLEKWDAKEVDLKADLTGWLPKKMESGEVNGEPAFIFSY